MSNELVDEKRQTVSEQQETRCTMRKRSRQDIRQDILNATLDEIEVQGPDFHMDDLARKMCISKRTLYEYFSSKQEIIKEALISMMDAIYDRHLELLQDPNLSAEEKLVGFFKIRTRTTGVFSMRRANQIFTKMPEICAGLDEYSQRDWSLLERLFQEAQTSEEFRGFDQQLLMHILRSASDGVLDYVEQTKDDFSYPEYMEKCIRIILYGIKKDRGLVLHDTET